MNGLSRRQFLSESAVAASGLVGYQPAATSVVLVRAPDDPVASSPTTSWALGELEKALKSRGVTVRRESQLKDIRQGERGVFAAGPDQTIAHQLLQGAQAALPKAAESLAMVPLKTGGANLLLCAGSDQRGLVYSLLEAADRVEFGKDPLEIFQLPHPEVERPLAPVRSISRLFVSELEDKPWFYDRSFWERYLTMLAAQRFNRFQLAFGVGYDFLSEVTDSYLHFSYPFLLEVPGYRVRAVGLPDEERKRNLDTVRFISEAAALRGLHFQLGLWTHGYAWENKPGVNYMIEGLNPQNHAAYCRDAMRELLRACPAVNGVTIRTHGESGIPEASYAFWRTVFEGIKQCGRPIEIDLHAKGLDERMIELALSTGMPVTVAPKYWAEHMGLPYHQAAIRSLEMPPKDRTDSGFFAKSEGSRRFMRYGYGDLMREDRKYRVLFRMWPGTQRMLLWGDPTMAAAYARASVFCGGAGVDLFEPLSFKGRKGSGKPGGRDGYADPSLHPTRGDWEKYLYTYRLWGRLLYNPETPPDTWRRFTRAEFGEAASEAENALANASRVLPLVTTAHDPSAANYVYWPEIYTNMPIVDPARPHPYGDTPSPKAFGTVSPLDPALFCSVEEHASALIAGRREARYSPIEVATWLEELAGKSETHLIAASGKSVVKKGSAFRRLELDTRIQIRLGRFFAGKLRAGVLFALFGQSGNPDALEHAIRIYKQARTSWVSIAKIARSAYVKDITYGPVPNMRGQWADRLPAIDADIADMEGRRKAATEVNDMMTDVAPAIGAALVKIRRPVPHLKHIPSPSFRRNDRISILVDVPSGGIRPISLLLQYRLVNQVEPYQSVEMRLEGNRYHGEIPAAYTDSQYPIMYFFEVRLGRGDAVFFPGLGPDLCGQPYFVIRQTETART